MEENILFQTVEIKKKISLLYINILITIIIMKLTITTKREAVEIDKFRSKDTNFIKIEIADYMHFS